MLGNPLQPISEAEFARLRAQHTGNLNTIHRENEEMDDDDDEVDCHSPIDLHISTALHAVMSAIRQCSDMNGGIPMVDEEGRPRRIDIAVDAGVSVERSGNVLGIKKHVIPALGRDNGADGGGKRERDNGDDGEGERNGSCNQRPRRHMRRSSV
ncbi:hypothetical protein SLS53_003146 [Cytospora paraplurivora]|uniref:Uncharacterized protein n=1 Tax=Cytospora paraplurivora TaxID=2898453 RepID=A0AAN9UC28_9PEZI